MLYKNCRRFYMKAMTKSGHARELSFIQLRMRGKATKAKHEDKRQR